MTGPRTTSCRAAGWTPCARGRPSSSTATTPRAWCGPRSSAPGSDPRRPSTSTSPRRRSPTSPTPGRSGTARRCRSRSSGSRPELRRTAEDGDLVVAVTDAETRILWTYGGRVMRRKAETRQLRGRRPLGRHQRRHQRPRPGQPHRRARRWCSAPSTTPQIVHNWVCWAAPVHDPVSGEQLGVIDLSTTWDRTHPIGLATARVMARLIETAMPASRAAPGPPRRRRRAGRPGLDLTLLGAAEARLDGQRLLLNRRQTEILALLALQPDGPLARAAARAALRRPGGHVLHPQGRGLPPPQRRSRDSSPRAPTG